MIGDVLKSFISKLPPREYWLRISPWAAGLLLILLLARNPFSVRTLIPNFEPFPDTFHYIVPIRSFLTGHGFSMYRNGYSFTPSVAPFYSFSLVPFFVLKNDPRMFYVANCIFAVVAYLFFVRIVKNIVQHEYIQVFLFFAYVTNYYISWYPQWAMAENLMLPIMLYGLSLFLEVKSTGNALRAGIVSVLFYGVKYAYAPLTVIYAALYVFHYKNTPYFKKFIAFLSLSFLGFIILDYVLHGRNLFGAAWGILLSLWNQYRSSQSIQGEAVAAQHAWFSLRYLPNNLLFHWRGLRGEGMKFLWDYTPILPGFIASWGLIGLVLRLFSSTWKKYAAILLSLLLGEVLFMSTFYLPDMRYLLFSIPFLLIGFGWMMFIFFEYCKAIGKEKVWYVLFLAYVLIFGVTNIFRIKRQIMVNIKYTETPWWYISVQETETFMKDRQTNDGKKPIVISAIPPYFFDYFSKNTYDLLPLSKDQEFRSQKKEVWGDHDYSDLLALYSSYLKMGRPLYVMTYGLGNESYLHQSMNQLKDSFLLSLEKTGCYNLCNIYSVRERTK